MDYHQNARLTVYLREQLARSVVEEKSSLKLAAASFKVSAKTAAKWVRRYRAEGVAGLRDRSSRPRCSPRRASSSLLEKVLALRRLRYNGWRIAREVGLSRATVSRILRRAGLNRIASRGLGIVGRADGIHKRALRELAIKVRSWPGLGRLLIDFESRVVVVFGFSRLSNPCRASTVTVCELEDTCKRSSARSCAPPERSWAAISALRIRQPERKLHRCRD